jgi:hypothetical protein
LGERTSAIIVTVQGKNDVKTVKVAESATVVAGKGIAKGKCEIKVKEQESKNRRFYEKKACTSVL